MTKPKTKSSNPTIPKAQATANETAVRAAYAENIGKVDAMIVQIRKSLTTHNNRFADSMHAGRVDWGYVGDLGHVATLLTEISEFLGKE